MNFSDAAKLAVSPFGQSIPSPVVARLKLAQQGGDFPGLEHSGLQSFYSGRQVDVENT
jgi:hypothetical protein